MQRLLKGDIGVSFRTPRPVLQDLLEKLPLSLEVVLWAMLLSLLAGIPTGVAAAYRQGSMKNMLVNWFSSAFTILRSKIKAYIRSFYKYSQTRQRF
jgi:ABC-type dipeptide/oligopeptide/nickel transport system permease component